MSANVGLQHTVCVCTAVRRASRAVTQFYDVVLAPTGLKSTQFAILQAIAGYGEVPQWRLAKDYVIAVETLSRRLGALRRKGMIELEVRGARAEHVYRLTDAGRSALEAAKPFWQRAQARMEFACVAGELERMIQLSDELTRTALNAESLQVNNLARAASA